MRIKKAIIRQPFNDSLDKEKINHSYSFKSNKQQKIKSNKQFRQLNQLFYQNYRVDKDKQGWDVNKNSRYDDNRRLGNFSGQLGRMRKSGQWLNIKNNNSTQVFGQQYHNNNTPSLNKQSSPSKQHNPQSTHNQSPTNLSNINSPLKNKQKILQKIKSNQNLLTKIKNNNYNIIMLREQQNYQYEQLKKRYSYQLGRELMDEHVNQLIRESLCGRDGNRQLAIDQSKIHNKSDNFNNNNNNITTNNKQHSLQQQQNNNLTLSTIKQKIQKYLSQQQSKLKQSKNINNLYSSNPKLNINKNKFEQIYSCSSNNNNVLQNESSYYNNNKRQGIFSSLTSLTRKKQVKFAYDMMKRRLNFSMINKPIIKNKQSTSNRNNKHNHNNHNQNSNKNVYSNNNHNNNDTQLNTHCRSLNLNQQAQLRKSFYIKSAGQEIIKMDEKIIHVLEKQPTLLDQKEKKVLISLGYRICGYNSQSDKMVNDNRPSMRARVKTEGGQMIDGNNYQTGQLHSNNNPNQLSQIQLNKSYLYNLSYFQSQQQKQHKPHNINNMAQNLLTSQQLSQRYKQWRRVYGGSGGNINSNNSSQQRLKYLLNNPTSNPIDPVETFYLGAFPNKNNNDIQSINYQKKSDPRLNQNNQNQYLSVLTNSQSASLSPLHRRKHRLQQIRHGENNFTQHNNTSQPHITHNNLHPDDKIIFVSKKYKQHSPPQKLSNLLQKIQKRNSQLQRISRLQVIEIFKSQNKRNKSYENNSKQQHKINGLNIAQYVQDEYNMLMRRQHQQQQQKLSQTSNNNNNSNFIVQWPKKQLNQINNNNNNNSKQLKKSNTTSNSPQKKRNKDDWSVFQPWKNQVINQDQYQVYYQQLAVDTRK